MKNITQSVGIVLIIIQSKKNIIMKTKTICAFACALFLSTANSSFTQATVNDKKFYDAYAASAAPSVNLSYLDTNASSVASVTTNSKVERSFAQYFKGATGQTWSMAGKNFHTSFYVSGLLTRALFDKGGELIYTITYGSEKDMPFDIRKMVKSEYYDYAITMAIEVQQDKRDI